MFKFIQNIGDYFSSNYFDEDFNAKVFAKTGYAAEDVKEFNKRISPLKDRYFRFKQLIIEDKLRIKDQIFESHQFHTEVLNALGFGVSHLCNLIGWQATSLIFLNMLFSFTQLPCSWMGKPLWNG